MFCPSGHCLCRTVQLESIRIWNDLQDAETLNSPLYEDTITQTFALCLNRQHSGQNRVYLFSRAKEAENGSDFLWLFFSSDLTRHFRVAVQAKRLYPSGIYYAFNGAQAHTMYGYAGSISALPVFVFYNFMPFRRGYYRFRGPRRYVPRRTLGLDHGRDLGAIYVPADDILRLSVQSLSDKHIAGVFLPLWHPFCVCDSAKAPSPLDQLADRFKHRADSEDHEAVGCLETDQPLRQWMVEGVIGDRTIEDLFRIDRDQPSDGFTPSFVMGTRLENGERWK